MALGLVRMWAALVPFVAWNCGDGSAGLRACGQGPRGVVSVGASHPQPDRRL